MHSSIAHEKIILASKSPRRKRLLEQFGLDIQVVPSGIDESRIPRAEPEQYVESLASAKAVSVARLWPKAWVIAADTIVVLDNRILGKPADRDQARLMLQQLSGKTHRVLTGISLCCRSKKCCSTRAVTTEVTFKVLSDLEIEWYLSTGQPYDKAGGYGIQGRGAFLVKRISGSYTNVVGLPVCETIELLLGNKVIEFGASKTMQSKSESGE